MNQHLSRHGFTLVELMIVIVIMGVLAAVGVPKLTTAIAKSKASEVAPAAASYIKLQNAYITERKMVGTWKKIGFRPPKSSNFEYDRNKTEITSKQTIDAVASGKIGLFVENLVDLGPCQKGENWKVTVFSHEVPSDPDHYQMEYKAEVSSNNCVAFDGGVGFIPKESETQVAGNPEKTYKYSQGLFLEEITNSDGKYSLSKAIVSGRQSSNMSGWTAYEQGASMSSAYGIEGYVFNKGKSNFSAADRTSLSTLLGGKEYQYEHILTELYDVSGDVSKVSAGIYKAKQSLYYGNQPSGTPYTNLLLYGVRDVFVKVDGSGAAKEFCADENCSQVIGVADNWDTSDVQQISDPFEQVPVDVLASSPLIQNQSKTENMAIATAIDKKTDNKAKKVDGIEGYVGSYNADAATFKPMLSETVSTQISFVRVSSQIFTNEPESGNLYAATLSLYYGANQSNYDFYERRKVYAVMDSKGTWYYFSDKEALNKISPNGLAFWQSEIGKME